MNNDITKIAESIYRSQYPINYILVLSRSLYSKISEMLKEDNNLDVLKVKNQLNLKLIEARDFLEIGSQSNKDNFYENNFIEIVKFIKDGNIGYILIDRSIDGVYPLVLYPSVPDKGNRPAGLREAMDDIISKYDDIIAIFESHRNYSDETNWKEVKLKIKSLFPNSNHI